jgi:hypothetical protein
MYNDIVAFLPDVVNGLIVLLVGYLIARIVGWLVRLVLTRPGLTTSRSAAASAAGYAGWGSGSPRPGS